MTMTEDKLYAQWAGLGITFQEDDPEFLSPEEVIVATIRHGNFPKDRKFFALMLLWLETYSDYVHVERLKRMLLGLPSHELALLGALMLKVRTLKKDHRFNAVINQIQSLLGEHTPTFPSLSDHPFFIQRHGLDDDFAAFGIEVAELYSADSKKIVSEDHLLSQNLWLRNRCLFGVNFRADIATVMQLYNPANGYQAAQLARCSTNSGYRHWRDLLKVGWLDMNWAESVGD
jgi:hypothetical protein